MGDIFKNLKLKAKSVKKAAVSQDGDKTVHTLIRKRRIVAICSIIAVGIIGTALIMSMNAVSKIDKYTSEMRSSLNASTDEYEKNRELDTTYADCMEEMADALTGYTAFYFSENGYNIFTREEVTEQLAQYVYIYYYHGYSDSVKSVENGYVLSDGGLKYELDNEETYKLLKNGRYLKGKRHFTAHQIDSQSYAILAWGMDDIFARKSILTAYSADRYQYVYRINTETGIIEDSSEEELIGEKYDEKIKKIGSMEYEDGEYSIINIEGKGLCLEIKSDDLNGTYLESYIPFSDLKYDYLSGLFLPCAFMWAFLILVLVYYLKFVYKIAETHGKSIEYVHLFGKFYADGRLVSHSVGLVLFATIITILAVFYFQTLLKYSEQDMTANNNLKAFETFLDNAQDNSQVMESDFLEMQMILCNSISDYYLKHQYKLDKENLTKMCHFMGGVAGITFYDNTGTIEYDTGNNLGYTLSRNEDAAGSHDYDLWKIIEGTSDEVGFYDAASDLYYAAGRRQDKNGAVAIKVAYSAVYDVLKLMEQKETLKTADFGYSDRVLVDATMPGTLFFAESGDDEVKKMQNNISETVDRDGFSGVVRLNGKRYFVNTRKNDNYTLLSAVRTSKLYGIYNLQMNISLIIIFILEELILVLVSMHRIDEAPENTVDIRRNSFIAQSIEIQTMDKRFRGTLKKMTILTAILIGVQMISDSIVSSNPVIAYLFSSQWPKGMNLFSLTMIIIVIVVGLLAGVIIEALLVFFSKSMGPRGLTIGRMTGSLIRFIDLIIVLVLCVRQVGFETSTVLAGAGIVGGLTLFCAQATVNDMLCGFFLVFENQFNIGDWITVDDFRGQVVEIGIRTTKLQKQMTYKVFNNSEVRKFQIAEYWDCGAIVNIDIAYKENAAAVMKLITDNNQRYLDEIPYITEGLHLVGVQDLGASGVTIGIRALSDVEYVLTVEREIRRVTKELLDENGIEIPFTQITMHMGSDMVADVQGLRKQ